MDEQHTLGSSLLLAWALLARFRVAGLGHVGSFQRRPTHTQQETPHSAPAVRFKHE